jgi:transposase
MGRKKVTVYQKIQALTLLQAGFTYENIRNQLGVSSGCISNIAKKEKSKLSLENRPGQGRKKMTTATEDRYLLNLMKKDRWKTSRQLASEWNLSNGKSISPQTVRRRLFNAGYRSYTTKRKPYRKRSHCSSRLRFAEKCSDWNFSDWKNVIFSDECHFEVFNRKNLSYVRRHPSESDKPFCFKPRVQGGGGSVSVWGAMTAKGVGPLVFYDGRLNGKNYINVIQGELLPYIEKNFDESDPWYYVQDNAPCHKSEFSMNWFKQNKINVLDWPAVSPDFNAIENLWDIIDEKLTNYCLTNVNDLQQAIMKLWTEIPIKTCEDLVRSMPRRMKKFIHVKGNTSSKY